MPNVNEVLASQLELAKNIARSLKNAIDKVGPSNRTLSHYESRSALLEKYWDKFSRQHDLLTPHFKDIQSSAYITEEVYMATEEEYLTAKCAFAEAIRELTPANPPRELTPTPSESNVQPSLPKIQLPTFSGKQEGWESFKHRFKALVIDQKNMSPVTILQHLLNSVQGDAEHRLKGLPIIDSNFNVTWERLIRRYDNLNIRLSTHIESLIMLPSVRLRNAHDLAALIDKAEESVQALRDLKCFEDDKSHFIVHCLIRKLDIPTKEAWNTLREGKEDFPSYKTLLTFLERRLQTLEQTQSSSTLSETRKTTKSSNVSANVASTSTAKPPRKCPHCGGDHALYACQAFNALSVQERYDCVTKLGLCRNCLARSHRVADCPSKFTCKQCHQKHHSKLHRSSQTHHANQSEKNAHEHDDCTEGEEIAKISAHSAQIGDSVLLATAEVEIVSDSGLALRVRALVDPAAEASFISERTVNFLSLPRSRLSIDITGVSAQPQTIARFGSSFNVRSLVHRSSIIQVSALVLPELTRRLPERRVLPCKYAHLNGLTLADPHYGKPRKADVILGADKYSEIIKPGLRSGPSDTPLAQNSIFGWLLTGRANTNNVNTATAATAYHLHAEPSISQALQKFWELEDIQLKNRILTPDEQFCETHFSETVTRRENGRFVVRLPLRPMETIIATRKIAAASLLRSEKQRARNPELNSAYVNFMNEYEKLGHMRRATAEECRKAQYYMPHHGVFKTGTKKIRVVFNASQKGSNGKSLNDYLLPGPKLQADISHILTRWRFFRFAFTADIVKMFRQFDVHDKDLCFQHILWRDNPSKPMYDYCLTTVTYGTAAAPFLAIRTMLQLAHEGEAQWPEAAQVIRQQTYVDDAFAGADTIEEALSIKRQLIDLLKSAQLELGKWSANVPDLLEINNSNPDELAISKHDDDSISTLGVRWLPLSDCFHFVALLSPQKENYTKRIILSETAKLFDPLGWLAPVIIVAKILLQDLWLHGIDWDSSLPPELSDRWIDFRRTLPLINTFKVPRWMSVFSETRWQLHGFADASKRAYAAVLYAVIPQRTSIIITAKSKVAPTKVETLPRLELCGAVLLSRLVRHLLDGITNQPDSVTLWSYSQVTLAWLQGHPSRWPTFVANRVSEVRTHVPQAVWRHVTSAVNPADVASRGTSPPQLTEAQLWWQGPSWLPYEHDWPSSSLQAQPTAEALKTCSMAAHTACIQDDKPFIETLAKYSNYEKLLRIIGLCYRWYLNRKRKSQSRGTGSSTIQELNSARIAIFRVMHQDKFKTELDCTRRGPELSVKSPLRRFVPILDNQGLLRVGGRLQNAILDYNEKHPIILPGNSPLIRCYVEHVHQLTLHGGIQLMRSHLARSVWITNGLRVVQGVYRRCITCTRYQARTCQQRMAPIPAYRLKPQRPFIETGIDFAGPFTLRISKGRGSKTTKGYVAVFVCMVTKAVHLEVTSGLTAEDFLAAYARFALRRGGCKTIYSDNATTFKAASVELSRLLQATLQMSGEIINTLAFQGTEWKFIPPRAPHFGGLWEAAVRSFKFHFERVVGDNHLTYEEMTTLAVKIEACLNSRPMSPLSSSATDEVALTPAHFLVGSPILTIPEPTVEEPELRNVYRRWQLITNMRNSFWNKWRKEVMNQYRTINKWQTIKPNLKVGDVVLLTDDLVPPATWPLARVTKLHEGKDGLVRVASVSTSRSEYLRAITKLIKLPTTMAIQGDAEEPSNEE